MACSRLSFPPHAISPVPVAFGQIRFQMRSLVFVIQPFLQDWLTLLSGLRQPNSVPSLCCLCDPSELHISCFFYIACSEEGVRSQLTDFRAQPSGSQPFHLALTSSGPLKQNPMKEGAKREGKRPGPASFPKLNEAGNLGHNPAHSVLLVSFK